MKRRNFVPLAILTLFLLSSLILITPFTDLTSLSQELSEDGSNLETGTPLASSMPPLPEGPSWDGSEYLYQGLGQVLTVQEYSHGQTATLGVTDLDFGESATGQIEIPQGWTGYQLTASVFNLFDNISHIMGNTRNGNFESGTTSPDYWVESQVGLSGVGVDGLSWNYGPDWGETGDGINVWANMSGYAWQSGPSYTEYIGWTQTIDLNRIDPTSAWLSFDVQFYDDNVHGRDDDDEMAVYVEVGGAERIFVCHRYCLNAYRGGWGFHNINFSLSVDELESWASDTINVTLGMSVDFDWTINNYFAMDFDNVILNVRGKPSPTANGLQLRLNSTSSWVSPTYGSGTISLTGTWGPYPSNENINAIWTTVSAISRDVDFNYTLTLYIQRTKTTEAQVGPEGSAFRVKQGTDVYWTLWFFANFYSTYYENYNFTIQKPTYWTLHRVFDPNLDNQTDPVIASSTGTEIVLSSSLIGTAFGWWNFTLTSTNRISSIGGLLSNYHIGDTLSINVNHNTVTSGESNISIYDWNRNLVHNESKSLTGSTQVSFSKLFDSGTTFKAGQYTICATYDNGETGSISRAGFYSTQFDIIHQTDMVAEVNPMTVLYNKGGFYYPRVAYRDLDRANRFIDNSTGTVTVSGTVGAFTYIFEQAGSYYQAQIPDDDLTPGDYILEIDADDPYYDAVIDYPLTVYVRSDAASLTSPQSPGLTLPYDESVTIQVWYNYTDTLGITTADVTTDWPTSPVGTHIGNGWYNITIDTALQPGPGTYPLKITADDSPNYVTRTLILTIVVREIATTLDYTSPGSVPWDENVVVDVHFTVNDPDSSHDNNNITSATFYLELDSTPISEGPDYSRSYLGGGQWRFTLLASSGRISTITSYDLDILADPTNSMYGNASITVGFNIRSLNTIITYTPPPPEPWGNDVVITLNFTVDDPASSSHDGDNILGLVAGDVTCLLDGSPLASFGWTVHGDQYNITIYSSDILTVKTYTLRISVTHSNTVYQFASRIMSFQVIGHQTQAIVNQPDPTPYGDQTNVSIRWVDLVTDTNLTDTELNWVALSFTNGTQIGSPTSLSFTLDTSTWAPGSYNLICRVRPLTNQYIESSGILRITILVHQTAVSIQPPEATPWGYSTNLTIEWFDLTAGGTIPIDEVFRIIVTGAVSQTFSSPLSSWTITVDTTGLGLGQHTLTITVEAKTGPQIYTNSSANVMVTIREHRVYVLVTGPPPVPEDGLIPISVSWTDLDTGSSISTAYLQEIRVTQISGPTAPTLPWSEFANLDFSIDATGWDRGTHRLNVTVYSNDPRFQDAYGTVNVIIRVHSISADVDSIPQVPVGYDVRITFRVDDSDLSAGLPEGHILSIEITGGFSPITLDSSNWATWVNNGTAGDGIYEITLDISGWSRNTYSLQFNVYTSTEYGDGVVYAGLTIRRLSTSFTYQSPPVVPYGEDGKLIVTYLVSDTNPITGAPVTTPISGATITIAGLIETTHFEYIYWTDGKYNITFYDTALTLIQTYQFDITITLSANYQVGQLDNVPLEVRRLFTWLHPTEVPLTPFGNDVILHVAFEVLDAESSINRYNISDGTITVTGLDGFSPTPYTAVWVGALQAYRITIDASAITAIAQYKIRISVSSASPQYESDIIPELTFNVRTVFTALTVEPVEAQPYAEEFTIRVTYTVNDPESDLHTRGIDGYASNITLVGFVGQYTVIPMGGLTGKYDIILNSSIVGAPGTYSETVTITWTVFPPQYAVQTKAVTLIVTERPTNIRNTIAGETSYIDFIKVNFTYSDQQDAYWITNTSFGGNHVLVTLYNATSGLPIDLDAYWVITLGVSEAFQLQINSTYFGKLNIFFDFRFEVTWEAGVIPYFTDQEFEFRAYVVGPRTEWILQAGPTTTAYGSIMTFILRYETEGGTGINKSIWSDVDIELRCQQAPFGIVWWYTERTDLPGGYYEISVDTTTLDGIGTYLFFVNVTYPDDVFPFFEPQYNEPVQRSVRYIETLLEYLPPGNLYYGDDMNITIQYYDTDNDVHVPIVAGDIIVTGASVLSKTQLVSGWWEIMLSTSGVPADQQFDVYIFANQSYYYAHNTSVPVYVYSVPLKITLESAGVIERYYGDPYPIIRVTITVGGGSQYGTYVDDAFVEAYWEHPTIVFYNEHNGTYWFNISTFYDVDRFPIELRAFKVGFFSNDSIFITYTITAGPSQLSTYECGPNPGVDLGTSFVLFAGQIYNIGVNFTTPDGTPITGATVTYSCADSDIGTGFLIETAPGIYERTFDSDTYKIFLYVVDVKATLGSNIQTQTRTFQIDVQFTPGKIQPEDDNYFITVEYSVNFTIIIYLNDTQNNQPIIGQNILATWSELPGGEAYLNPMSGGYYNYTIPATKDAGFTYPLHLDFTGPGSFRILRATLTIQINPRPTQEVNQIEEIESVRDQWSNTINTLQVPVGDWLFIYLNYTDIDGTPIPGAAGAVRIGDVSAEEGTGEFMYDATRGLYVVKINASSWGRGFHSLLVSIRADNFEKQDFSVNFEIISIPTELIVTHIDGIEVLEPGEWEFYIGNPVSIRLYLNDTWHNEPIDDATITLPSALNGSGFNILPQGNGVYEIQGTWTAFSFSETAVALTVTAEKLEPLTHELAVLEGWVVTFGPHQTLLLAVYGGIGAAVTLILVLIGWILWARVFSIPWEVRRMRKLAKTVEKEEGYTLSRKDYRKFHQKGVILEGKIDDAMSTIGVAATPAMIPAVEEIVEVTATEEDIMGELDKIPGLGPEEKAVLAEEMRKIPRKDRIWFLDDLKRQMGMRRMDFLTQRERPVELPPPPEPAPEPKVEPEPKPKRKPKPKAAEKVEPTEEPAVPLEEVKPEEPPEPDKALTEDRTAPTVLPPERVAPTVPSAVEIEIRRELDKIPGLDEEEKQALVDHLKYLSKEERQATYNSLKQTANDD